MKNKQLHENHTRSVREYQVVMPLDVGMKIEADESVRTLYEVTERMDYKGLTRTYQRHPRRGEATPKQMFQIVMLGFMLGIYATRAIERACRNDIRFMYLLRGRKAPDHSRIASFIKEHLQGAVMEDLFYQLVRYLAEQEEIRYEHVFVDGTKIEANANRYSFVWAKSTNRYEGRVDEKLGALIERLTREYGIFSETAKGYRDALQEEKESKGVAFVKGRGHRKSPLQRDIEGLDELIWKKAKYRGYQAEFRGRNSFSKTDRDATFMRMKEDHMKNGQLKPGYNVQLAVEGEYTVGVYVGSWRGDGPMLPGLLERMDAGLKRRHKTLTGDAGYESEENYKLLESRGQAAYIKPQNYERSKTRKYRNNAYLQANMPYDAQSDRYICPAGKYFVRLYETRRKSETGYESRVTVYECSGCAKCEQRRYCTRAKGNRRLQVSKDFVALREASRERITSELGKTLRLNRSIQSEGAFGVLKQDYGFRRFLRRGEANVFTEMLLYGFAYNMNKLHNKRMQNRLGYVLHLLSSA